MAKVKDNQPLTDGEVGGKSIKQNAGFKYGFKKILTLNELAQSEIFELKGPVCLIVGKVLLDSDYMKKNDQLKNNFMYQDMNKKIENTGYGK